MDIIQKEVVYPILKNYYRKRRNYRVRRLVNNLKVYTKQYEKTLKTLSKEDFEKLHKLEEKLDEDLFLSKIEDFLF